MFYAKAVGAFIGSAIFIGILAYMVGYNKGATATKEKMQAQAASAIIKQGTEFIKASIEAAKIANENYQRRSQDGEILEKEIIRYRDRIVGVSDDITTIDSAIYTDVLRDLFAAHNANAFGSGTNWLPKSDPENGDHTGHGESATGFVDGRYRREAARRSYFSGRKLLDET